MNNKNIILCGKSNKTVICIVFSYVLTMCLLLYNQDYFIDYVLI